MRSRLLSLLKRSCGALQRGKFCKDSFLFPSHSHAMKFKQVYSLYIKANQAHWPWHLLSSPLVLILLHNYGISMANLSKHENAKKNEKGNNEQERKSSSLNHIGQRHSYRWLVRKKVLDTTQYFRQNIHVKFLRNLLKEGLTKWVTNDGSPNHKSIVKY